MKENEDEQNVLYYYKDDKGVKFYTGNLIFAAARAGFFGTEDVYILEV